MQELARRWWPRIEALVCTGFPGVYRLAAFFLIERVYSLRDLGRASSSLSFAQIAGFFTAIGWATLILVRVPAASSRKNAIGEFYSLCAMAVVTAAGIAGIAALIAIFVEFDLSAFFALMFGWSAYQLPRHYFVAHKRYRVAIGYDLLLIAQTVIAVLLFRRNGLSAPSALAVALGATGGFMLLAIGAPTMAVSSRRYDPKGLQFGLTNALGGGIALLFVPVAKELCGAEFAGILSLIISVTAIGILVPRAISLAQLPDLAKRKGAADKIEGVLRSMRHNIAAANVVVLIANCGAVFWFAFHKGTPAARFGSLVAAGLLVSAQSAVSIMATVDSCILMVFERGGTAANINLITTGVFLATVPVGMYLAGVRGVLFLLGSAIIVTAARNWFVRAAARRTCLDYTSGPAKLESSIGNENGSLPV